MADMFMRRCRENGQAAIVAGTLSLLGFFGWLLSALAGSTSRLGFEVFEIAGIVLLVTLLGALTNDGQARGYGAKAPTLQDIVGREPAFGYPRGGAKARFVWWAVPLAGVIVATQAAYERTFGLGLEAWIALSVVGTAIVWAAVWRFAGRVPATGAPQRAIDAAPAPGPALAAPHPHLALGAAHGFIAADLATKPFAQIQLTQEEIQSRLGVFFEDMWDGSEFLRCATFDLPGPGRIVLVCRAGGPVEVHAGNEARAPSAEWLGKALGLGPQDVVAV